MKANVDRSEFVAALKKANRGLNNLSIGTLCGYQIYFQKEKQMGMIIGASAVFTVRAFFHAEVDEDFNFVTAEELFKVTSKLVDDTLLIEKREKQVMIKGDTVKLKLPILALEPSKLKSAYDKGTTMNIKDCSQLIKGVIHAIPDKDSQNRIMQSIHMSSDEESLQLIALDGHRIAIRKQLNESGVCMETLIHGDVMKTVADLIPGTVRMNIMDELVTFSDEKTIIDCAITAGKYFNINSLFGDINTYLTMNRKELLYALELTSLVNADCILSTEDEDLIVASIANNGDVHTKVAVKQSGKEFKTMRFAAKFILDALKTIPDDEVTLEINAQITPAIIRGDGYTELILPKKMI